jgi:hypothetical protein
MRAQDDNHALATDSSDWKWHRTIKEIRLSTKALPYPYISFGGEDREQFRYFSHLNFGDVGTGVNDEDIYLQHRLLLHGDLHMNRFLRVFLQLNSCHANGRNSALHQVDRDDLGIMQAFVDLDWPTNMQLRIGRQELTYGMDRIIALRDGPTIRQNFDGARLMLSPGRATGDLLLVQPVLYRPGVFDNSRRKKEYILGSYWSMPLSNYLLELYYFNGAFQNACFASDTAYGNLHYTGFRFNKPSGAFTCDLEFTWQFGMHGSSNVKAWHLSYQADYRWINLPWQPRLLFRQSVFSGDRNDADHEINTFRPISARPQVYDLVPIGSANIIVVSPEFEVVLTRDFYISFRYFNVRRFSSNDGMYPSDMRRMTRIKDSPGVDLGHQIINGAAFEILYYANKHVTLLLYGGIFKPGNYIRNTGEGHNIEAFSFRAHYKF